MLECFSSIFLVLIVSVCVCVSIIRGRHVFLSRKIVNFNEYLKVHDVTSAKINKQNENNESNNAKYNIR